MDNLIECKRCQGNACYEQKVDENVTTWLCMGCGFTSSTLMNENSDTTRSAVDTMPELHKDLMFIDHDKYVWLPATISLPNKGMVFLDGNDSRNWNWSAVLSTPLTDEEIKSGKYPKNQTSKVDMSTLKKFGQKEFMDALEVIGFYEIE